jgi:hypothetical protein
MYLKKCILFLIVLIVKLIITYFSPEFSFRVRFQFVRRCTGTEIVCIIDECESMTHRVYTLSSGNKN